MSIQDVEKLKGLKRQLSKAEGEYDALKIEFSNIQRQCNEKRDLIHNLTKQVESLSSIAPIRVSDHAIVRYFERVLGYEIAEIKERIVTPDVTKMVETLGANGTYPVTELVYGLPKPFQIVIRDNNVITIKT